MGISSIFRKFTQKGSFQRYFITILSGTFMAQLIAILSAPILSRIYSPKEYGQYGIFWSLATIALLFATGKFEVAIILPKQDKEARNLAKAALFFSLITALFMGLGLLLFFRQAISLLGLSSNAFWLYLIPFTLVLWGLNQTLYYWANRKKLYPRIASNRMISSLTVSLAGILFGLAGLKIWGLLGGQLMSLLVGCLLLAGPFLKWHNDGETARPWRLTAREYRKYSIHTIPAGMLSTLAHQLPILFFGTLFGAPVAGLYFFSYRLINLPVSLVGGSLTDVFYKYSVDHIEDQENFSRKMEKSVAYLLLISLLPVLVLLLAAGNLFALLFGSEWRTAGTYAQILVPFFLFRFLSSPLTVFYQKKMTLLLLKWQAIFCSCIVLSLLTGSLLKSPLIAVSCISLLGSCCYCWLLFINFRLTGASFRNIPHTMMGIIQELKNG